MVDTTKNKNIQQLFYWSRDLTKLLKNQSVVFLIGINKCEWWILFNVSLLKRPRVSNIDLM